MFRKVLIANRGVVACRIIRTLRRLGIAAAAVYSEADRHARHVIEADEAHAIGPAAAAQSYLSIPAIIAAARVACADAIHPGYGFLAENADFAEACAAAGVVFIGPPPGQIRQFGLKHRARALAQAAGVRLAPGSDLLPDLPAARAAAREIGYPVMLKSTAGGGGIGLLLCPDEPVLDRGFERVAALAGASFGQAGLFLERYVAHGRHIEVQIFGDGAGRVQVLGDRDCSAQRRHQKVIEETPAPNLPDPVRNELHNSARRLGESVAYANAGTVEFIYDIDTSQPYFLEVNTRLQVEHGITEAALGIDLVEWMLRQAAGLGIPEPPAAKPCHAIQLRLYAEDPAHDYRPDSGQLTEVSFPPNIRVDTCVTTGTDITPHYDPMLATLIVRAPDRKTALRDLAQALAVTRLAGIATNLAFLRHLLATGVLDGTVTTATLASIRHTPPRLTVLAPGTQTTVQSTPGRLGFWHVGIPPSGPMDDRSFRLANRAVGNPEDAAGLEIILQGPTLRFEVAATICLAGAELPALLNGTPIPYWQPIPVPQGAILAVGSGAPAGSRAYLAVAGGLEVPAFLGSTATFTSGHFGGHRGRALLSGDTLPIGNSPLTTAGTIPEPERPALASDWTIAVQDGPHGAPDFFTEADIATFYSARWEVHYNSDRTGIRLIGPRPGWARADGGEAGLHPSNIHDTPYAIGAVDFTGDMPVILGPDGPSLGGFVCPVTILRDELWKIGQLRAGDTIRFRRPTPTPIILATTPETATTPRLVIRASGDRAILVEYGDMVLDLELRLRVHLLMQALQHRSLPGIIETTPGIRSLQIQYDPARLPVTHLLSTLQQLNAALPANDDVEIPSRIVHLPLSWDDPATREAIARYARSVRPDAPWCPSNIEFIRRINGLATEEDVRRIVFAADYLVLGLGDVYLGAPVATPLDPRHRLVTTKYNPARTWTPENAVGIGGAYLCVYGMEGPGGYQFVGRTCQMWNSHRTTPEFQPGHPWLLRFFDRIRFYEVSAEELLRFRDDFPHGQARLQITEGTFRLRDHRRLLAEHATDIAAFKSRQQAAFEAERTRWQQAGPPIEPEPAPATETNSPQPGHAPVPSPIAGSVWKLLVTPGETVAAGQPLLILEAMKSEIALPAPTAGRISRLRCAEGQVVNRGQVLLELGPDNN